MKKITIEEKFTHKKEKLNPGDLIYLSYKYEVPIVIEIFSSKPCSDDGFEERRHVTVKENTPLMVLEHSFESHKKMLVKILYENNAGWIFLDNKDELLIET